MGEVGGMKADAAQASAAFWKAAAEAADLRSEVEALRRWAGAPAPSPTRLPAWAPRQAKG